MNEINVVSQVIEEKIIPISTKDAIVEWNRNLTQKRPPSIVLLNRLVASISEEHDRTWFELLLEILDQLPAVERNLFALNIVDENFVQKVAPWPGVWCRAVVMRAEALLGHGRKTEILDLVGNLYARPYLFTDIPTFLRVYYCHLLASGRILNAKQARLFFRLVLHSGQTRIATFSSGQQLTILKQLCLVYRVSSVRHILKVLGDSTDGFLRNFVFRGLEHDLFFQARKIKHKNWYKDKRLERKRMVELLSEEGPPRPKVDTKQILVTRTQGGLGDILMMNYALQELRRSKPSHQIVFAVPRSYLPWASLFEGIIARNIHDADLCLSDYEQWYNLSECPAGHEESGPLRDQISRIETWCKSLEVSYRSAVASPPRLEAGTDASDWAKTFLAQSEAGTDRKTIALQWASADAYKDYPFMRDLALQLAKTHRVLVFHSHPLPEEDQTAFEGSLVKMLIGLSPQRILALLNEVDLTCGPDSSFVHIVGQIQRPGIVLSGPINGKLQTKDYPTWDFIDLRKELNCIPCWRNEMIPCLATGDFSSLCLRSIEVKDIIVAIERKLSGHPIN